MRILVADQNALLLAAITATFGPHCDLVTATRRDVCIAQIETCRFDVLIACDKLADYTGLELLSEVGAISPDTLLIFAANPKRLNQLENRLAVFGLFEVLSYPITPRKLLDVLKRARQSIRTPRKPKIKHVVLDSEWDTGVRLALLQDDLDAQAETTSADPRVEAEDFVFSGPPVVAPESEATAAPATRTENRARTFDATPVGSRVAHNVNAGGTDAREVIEYEVKPVILALEHETGTIACEDEFIFASSESVPVSMSAGTAELIEAELTEVPGPQEPQASSIDDFCSNDPLFDVPEPPRWAEDGAANDMAYEGRSAAPAPISLAYGNDEGGAVTDSGSRASRSTQATHPGAAHASNAPRHTEATEAPASSRTSSPPEAKATPSPKAPPKRRTRTQSVPTEAQRAAFERAVARRNAAAAATPASDKARRGAKGGERTEPSIQAASMDSLFAGAAAAERPAKSLSELAKIATRKRPLSASSANPNKSGTPKRTVYAVGSGLAAVLILAAISFELHRGSQEPEHHLAQAQATSTQLFSSKTLMLENNGASGAPQFGPPPMQQQAAAPQNTTPPPDMPEAQNFDPNVAPEDPPPPPALEQPGPMEPPSEDVHTGPPLGMIQGDDGAALPPRE